MDISKYILPTLGAACIGGALLVGSAMRTPVELDPGGDSASAEARVPKNLVLDGYVPTMEEVVAKHLFVPERKATGENAFPDLLVKGVYVGETRRNAVFSLKSRPVANLRVWQGDEEAVIAQVVDERDPRKPIADFLGEWEIKSIDFAGVTVRHIITGEVETYAVDYKPLKHAKDSAGSGYGQGMVVDASAAAGTAKPAAAKPGSAAPAAQPRAPGGSTQAIAGRVGQYMQNLSPAQRQQFLQQLQKQNAAAKGNGGTDGGDQRRNSNGSSGGKKSDSKKSSGQSRRR